MVSFVSHILKYRNAQNPAGDVARDMLQDPNVNRRWGFESLVNYLITVHNIDSHILCIITDLYHGYLVNRPGKIDG